MPVWNHPKKIDQHTHHGRKHAFHTQKAENYDFPPIIPGMPAQAHRSLLIVESLTVDLDATLKMVNSNSS